MRILVACEESQIVCNEFRRLGHIAFSCDIEPCSGGHPEWHIQGDALQIINGNCNFVCQAGNKEVQVGAWDLLIAHPPCTFLTITGNRWFNIDKYGEKAIHRYKERENAYEFFMKFVNADCERIAIENPIGYMSKAYQKPTQIIHPYYFGDHTRKATCLWLKGLKPLVSTNVVEPVIIHYKNGKGTDNPWHMETMNLPPKERAKARSKTFPGIAKAMAEQWGKED